MSRVAANPVFNRSPVQAVQSRISDVRLQAHIPRATACSHPLPQGRWALPAKASSTVWAHRRAAGAVSQKVGTPTIWE